MGRLRGLGEEISPSLPAAPNFLHYFLRDPLVRDPAHPEADGLLDDIAGLALKMADEMGVSRTVRMRRETSVAANCGL